MKLKDLTGKRFGNLVVTKRAETNDNRYVKWECLCDCGNKTVKFAISLLRGTAKSCGCHRYEDLTNKKFGRLTAISIDTNKKKWKCICDCGNIHYVKSIFLKTGISQSCGCLQKELVSNKMRTHGKSKTRLYCIYNNMKDRCYNPKNKRYKNYGGRGIKICEEWSKDFNSFYEWAINNGYKEYLSIDRINNDGNYEPKNCRWATSKEQRLNTTNNHKLTYNGETHTIYEWAEITGINYKCLLSRINYYKWDIERAFTEKPIIGKNQYYRKENTYE